MYKRQVFAYVRRWLKWGLISHKASTMVERVMRELARRLKNIAYGWSDKGAKKVAAVSYTHLRAHETVLELVCRLLLEKKNTKLQHVRKDTYRCLLLSPYTVTC